MLDIDNLRVEFTRYGRGGKRTTARPVNDLTLDMRAGEILAVIGSSGSGKSLLAHALLGLLPANARISGVMTYRDKALTPKRIRKLRGREIALVPQSVAHLNPLVNVGRQVYRAARLSGQCCQTAATRRDESFERYNLRDTVRSMFPFQVSGGMARRVLTATATAGDARLLIADEPTTGLDEEAARSSLEYLRRLADGGKSVMLISHDLETALSVADRVAVFYAGSVVEIAPVFQFRENGHIKHPYTQALWDALPGRSFTHIPGNQPAEDDDRPGCSFADRCPRVRKLCRESAPEMRTVEANRVRCHHA